jgi:hypothetical protein
MERLQTSAEGGFYHGERQKRKQKLIQPIDVRVWQTAHFPQELCLKRRISGLAVNKAVCLQLFHSTLHPGHIRAAMPEELPDENLDFL